MIPLGTYPKGTKLRLTDISSGHNTIEQNIDHLKDTIVTLRKECEISKKEDRFYLERIECADRKSINSLYAWRFSLIEENAEVIVNTDF